MKISDLLVQLQFLNAHYGDLECVVGVGAEIQPMRHLKVRMLEQREAGALSGVGAGQRVSVIGVGETSLA